MADKNLKHQMEMLFKQSGLPLTQGQLDMFWSFYTLFEKHNKELDLSRLTRFEDIIVKHFIDSAYIINLCDIPSPLLDIGTGAGFPGIPLKIIKPSLKVILAEPRKKRVTFLNKAIKELGLNDITVYPHLVSEHSFFEVNGIITRALESIDDTLQRACHFLPQNGKILFMKGPSAHMDLRDLSGKNKNDFSVFLDSEYTLPKTNHKRRLIIFEKKSPVIKMTYKILKNIDETAGTVITSSENKNFKELKKLTSTDAIKKYNKTIISGKKQIGDLVSRMPQICQTLIIFDGYSEDDGNINNITKSFSRDGKLLILKKALYNELDIFNTGSPLLIIQTPEIAGWDYTSEDRCTLLIPFQDPVNVGALIRSAAGFGIKNIVLLQESAFPFHPKCIRASGGAVFAVKLLRGPSIDQLEDICKENSLTLITLDKHGSPINSFNFPDKFLLLPGIEGPGLPESMKKNSVSIPISEEIESLNAAIAASIALFVWKSRSGHIKF